MENSYSPVKVGKQISGNGICPQPPSRTLAQSIYWKRWKNHIDCVASKNANMSDPTISEFGSLPVGNFKWYGGVTTPDGFIYASPQNSSQILKVNTNDDTISLFGDLGIVSAKWRGCVYAPNNGKIYFTPYNDNRIMVVDPNNGDSISYIDTGQVDAGKFTSGIWCDGFIYCAPLTALYMLKINTMNDTCTIINTGAFGSGSPKFLGGSLASNGYIYFVPNSISSTAILKLNPADDSITFIGNFPGRSKYRGCTLAVNGCIYASPSRAAEIMKIDTSNDAVTLIPHSGFLEFSEAGLGPDGRIYFTNIQNDSCMVVDPSDDSFSYIGSPPVITPTIGNWIGGVMAPNGNIYVVPHTGTTVLKLTFAAKRFSPNICMSPYYNKF